MFDISPCHSCHPPVRGLRTNAFELVVESLFRLRLASLLWQTAPVLPSTNGRHRHYSFRYALAATIATEYCTPDQPILLRHSRAAVVGFNGYSANNDCNLLTCESKNLGMCSILISIVSCAVLDEGAPCGLAESASRWYPCEDTPNRLIDESAPV